MNSQRRIEIIVGIFMLAGLLALCGLALKVSGLSNTYVKEGYRVTATFDNVGGLKERAPVTIAGVRVGKVANIRLNPETYQAKVTLLIDSKYHDIPIDSSARILTEGLLGSNYISLTPGFSSQYLQNGALISNTHAALILENLIGQLLFNAGDNKKS